MKIVGIFIFISREKYEKIKNIYENSWHFHIY